ncbi:hypothetical protein NLJ89_g2851 [Agrocybe chaxingu]|uniref:F-box domain-containing protein n=1 Tax=Agrocybe chaxingu TaxID=84603 RepID=A0A9W8K613_9AGAR|nr:hypothetical protein NLJ89_g2851 [Agrocybe chaxingu]
MEPHLDMTLPLSPLARWSLIVQPEDEARKPKVRRTQSRKRAKAGPLKHFVDLPLDVVYEVGGILRAGGKANGHWSQIVSHLKPLDLLNLSRSSKGFRDFFLSRSSAALWRTVLHRLGGGIPPCPHDLTEPQYASLLFDKFCMACGTTIHVVLTDFKLKLKLCNSCKDVNICFGCDAYGLHGETASVAFQTIPRWSGWTPTRRRQHRLEDLQLNSNQHLPNAEFFKPELELAVAWISSLGDLKTESVAEFNSLVTQLGQHATALTKEGLAIELWMENYRKEEAVEMREERFKKISKEIKALRWDEQYFPQQGDPDFAAWDKFLHEEKELTDRRFAVTRTKMTNIYDRRRKEHLTKVLLERVQAYWIKYRSIHPPEERRRMPGWGDIEHMPVVQSFVDEHYSAFTDVILDEFMQQIIAATQHFFTAVKRDLDIILSCGIFHSPNFSLLEMARAVFICGDSALDAAYLPSESSSLVVKAYPEVVEYLVDASPHTSWSLIRPYSSPLLHDVTREVLEALNILVTATRNDVRALEPFECTCYHPDYTGRLSFEKLINHVYKERRWHRYMAGNASNLNRQVLLGLLWNSHSGHELSKRVRLISPEKNTGVSSSGESSGASFSTALASSFYCAYCYAITGDTYPVAHQDAEWHMMYRHSRPRAPGDLCSLEELERNKAPSAQMWNTLSSLDDDLFSSEFKDAEFEEEFNLWFDDHAATTEISHPSGGADENGDRLSLIILPYGEGAPKKKTGGRYKGKGIAGKLRHFVDLPLDIVYEIISHMRPIDLLNLSRASKDFRAFFLSRDTAVFWRRVFSRLGDVPPCPEDLNEPQYASLLFDKFCMLWLPGLWDDAWNDHDGLRHRTQVFVCAGDKLDGAEEDDDIYDMESAFSMLPRFLELGGIGWRYRFEAERNGPWDNYFKPELRLAIRAIKDLETWSMEAPEEYRAFVTGLQIRATSTMNEMKAMRWEERYFPDPCHDNWCKWNKFLHDRKELTDRGWVQLRPRLTAIYEQCKKDRQVKVLLGQLEAHWTRRRSTKHPQPSEVRHMLPPWADVNDRFHPIRTIQDFALKNFDSCSDDAIEQFITDIEQNSSLLLERIKAHWIYYRARNPPAVRRCMPGWGDIEHESRYFLIPQKFSIQNYIQQCTDHDLERLMGVITYHTQDFFETVKRDLESIRQYPFVSCDINEAGGLFLCDQLPSTPLNPSPPVIKPYPQVIEHLVDASPLEPWCIIRPRHSSCLFEVLQDVIYALRLPLGSTRTDALALGWVVCKCRHPRFSGPITFDLLVKHVYEEQSWHRSMKASATFVTHCSPDLLWNSHSGDNLLNLVDVAPTHEQPEDSLVDMSSSWSRGDSTTMIGPYPLVSEDADWHMFYRHGTYRTPNDVDELLNLQRRYPSHQLFAA